MPSPQLPKMTQASGDKQINQDSMAHASFNVYEQERANDKQILRDMLIIYEAAAAKDTELTAAMTKVKVLANFNNSASSDFSAEVQAYKEAMEALEMAQSQLADKEKSLNEEAHNKLGHYDENNNFVWYTETEIQADPKLIQAEAEIVKMQNDLENSQHMVADLQNYLQSKKNGNLDYSAEDPNARHINAVGKKFDMADYELGLGTIADAVVNWGQNVAYYTKSMKDWPLFPHEPNVNDICQGAVSDCFYIAGLSSIAKVNPDFIKNSMRDNGDGSVTVRLFSKSKEGKYAPVYVTVDKTIPQYFYVPLMGQITGGSQFSLWVVCYEKALAASGLYSYAKADMDYWEPIPEDADKIYAGLEKKKKEGKLTGDELKFAQRDYPWAFMHPDDNQKNDLLPWPNFNSISGGRSAYSNEMVTGPDYKGKFIEIPRRQTAKSLSIRPETVEQFIALSVINMDFSYDENNVGEQRKTLELATTREELIEQAWASLQAQKAKDTGNARGIFQPFPDFPKEKFIKCFDAVVNAVKRNLTELQLEPNTKNFVAATQHINVNPNKQEMDLDFTIASSTISGEARRTAMELNVPLYTKGEEQFYSTIRKYLDMKLPVAAGSVLKSKYIFGGHQYSILDVYEAENGRKFVTLRNPWGGRDGKNGLITTINEDGTKTHKSVHVDDGIFDMELDDFVQEFDVADVNGYDLNEIQLVDESRTLGGIDLADPNILLDDTHLFNFLIRYMIKDSCKDEQVLANMNANAVPPEIFQPAVLNEFLSTDEELFKDQYKDNDVTPKLERRTKKLFLNFKEIISNYCNGPHPEDKSVMCQELSDLLTAKTMEYKETAAGEDPLGRLTQRMQNRVSQFFLLNAEQLKDNLQREEKLDGLFKKIETVLSKKDNNIKVYYKRATKELTDTPRPEITEVFINEKGVRCAKVNVPGSNTRTIAFRSLFLETDHLTIQDNRPEVIRGEQAPMHDLDFPEAEGKKLEWIAKQPKKEIPALEAQENIAPENRQISLTTLRDYLKILNDVDTVFGTTKQFFDTSSTQYKNLCTELKAVRSNLAHSINKPFKDISKVMDSLEPMLDAYNEHCSENVMDNWRRNTRIKGCELLRGVMMAARQHEQKPMELCTNAFARKIATQMLADRKMPAKAKVTDQLTRLITENKAFKGYAYNSNALDIATAKGSNLKRHMKNLETIRFRNILGKEDKLEKDIKNVIAQSNPNLM